MKDNYAPLIVLLMALFASCASANEAELESATVPEKEQAEGEKEPNWVDSSHAYATDATQELVQWMDDFFGTPSEDAERAESFLHLILVDDWDAKENHDFKVRVRGQVQVPKISERLSLVFSGEDGDNITEENRTEEDSVGVRYTLMEALGRRFDVTLGVSSGQLKPGIRFRDQGAISDHLSYRFTQRAQFWTSDGWLGTTQFELNYSLSENAVLSWGNGVRYGKKYDGKRWGSAITYRRRFHTGEGRNAGVRYFVRTDGTTHPETYAHNYTLGAAYRQQFYRDFLYFEVEPTYSWRRETLEERREGVWGVVLRLEILLERDLIHSWRKRDWDF